MLSEQEKQVILNEIDTVKATIRDIKAELDKLNREKEGWMAKKNSYKQEILNIIHQVKELKNERNNLTSQVHTSKVEREKVDKMIPDLQVQLDKLKKEREDLSKKLGMKESPGELRREIDAMSTKLETVPMSFEAEKKLMKQIKDKKKELQSSSQVNEISKKIRILYEELDMYKKIRTISHSKVQSIAKNSQNKHESMIEESKKIDELKAKEEEAFGKFKELKEQFKAKSVELNVQIDKVRELGKKVGISDNEERANVQNAQKRTLEQKRREVEDKLKRGEKLTTEDILVLQSGSDNVE